MTWFETKQIIESVTHITEDLDNWAMDNVQMRNARSVLMRLYQKLQHELDKRVPAEQAAVFQQLLQHIAQCRLSIEERLKR